MQELHKKVLEMRAIAEVQKGFEFAKGSTIPPKDRRQLTGHDLVQVFDAFLEMEQRLRTLASEPKGLRALGVFRTHIEALGYRVELEVNNGLIKMTATRGKEQ